MSRGSHGHTHWVRGEDCSAPDCYRLLSVNSFNDAVWGLGKYTVLTADQGYQYSYFGQLIHEIKYRNETNSAYDERIAKLANSVFEFSVQMLNVPFDCCVTIPSNRNSASSEMQLLAENLQALGVCKHFEVLEKDGQVPVMKSIPPDQRRAALREKYFFRNDCKLGDNAKILVLDDVYESGASMQAAMGAVFRDDPNRFQLEAWKITGLAVTYLRDPKVKP
jgi:hypothetical protein